MFQRGIHSQDIPRKERPQAHRSVSRSHGYPQWLDEDPSATQMPQEQPAPMPLQIGNEKSVQLHIGA